MITDFKCPYCGHNVVMTDEGYSTIYRCQCCGHMGDYDEFV